MADLAERYFNLYKRLDSMNRVYPTYVTKRLIDLPSLTSERLRDETQMQDWCRQLEKSLESEDGQHTAGLNLDSEHQTFLPAINRRLRGSETHFVLDLNFLDSGVHEEIMRLSDKTAGLIEPGARVVQGNAEQPIATFGDAYDWLLSRARNGVRLQRYKGLGEMNPGQLWETTMDPDVRRMSLVTINDAGAANQIFSELMGEDVEPRRKFIQEKALTVSMADLDF